MGEFADDLIDQGMFDYYDGRDEEDYDGDPGYYRRRSPPPPPVRISGFMVHSTARAVLWQFASEEVNQEWFPRTQIIEIGKDHMLVSSWIAAQKGIR